MMNQDAILSKVSEILREQCGLPSDYALHRQNNIERDLGTDSLDRVEIVLALEEDFEIEIPDEDAEGLKTVGDIVDFIAAAKKS